MTVSAFARFRVSLRNVSIALLALGLLASCGDDDCPQPTRTTLDPPAPVTDVDGNVYRTVRIGSQIWMAENLRATHYRDGSPLLHVSNDLGWGGQVSGAYGEYGGSTDGVEVYGRLYNWYAVDSSTGLAPEGWHVASDDDWKILEMYLGMTQADADLDGFRGVVEGGKLKEAGTAHWSSPNRGATDEFGFTALPGGVIFGSSSGMHVLASYWTSTSSGTGGGWTRFIVYEEATIDREILAVTGGCSIRCVKD